MDWLEGDKVLLLQGYYVPGYANPCIGSEWECPGTVVEIIEDDEDYIVVVWDNDSENTYHHEELTQYDPLPHDNPNRTFIMHRFKQVKKEQAEKEKAQAKKYHDKYSKTEPMNIFGEYTAKYFYKGDAEE